MTDTSSDAVVFEGPNFSTSSDEVVEGDGTMAENANVAEKANVIEGGTAQAVLEHLAKSIVDDPEAVIVDASPSRSGVKLSLHVNPQDMGRIIGKRGRVAQAVRTVVRAAAARDGSDASVDIVD